MGRPTEGWTLRPRGKNLAVRFTHNGRQVELSTGSADPERASKTAARIYSDTLAGKRPERRRAPRGPGRPLGEVGEEWLNDSVGTLDERTIAEYAIYFETHLAPFFITVEAVTPEKAKDYRRQRLKSVQATTVRKELSALRGAMTWLYGDDAPTLPGVPKRVLGTPYEVRRRGEPTELTVFEVRRLLAALPECTRRGKLPARAYFTVLYETALRPDALATLSVPGNYRRGRKQLVLTRSQDKARWGRPVPLTGAARRALDSVAPPSGLIFGKHDWRAVLAAAAVKARLAKDKRVTLCPYDLRHARLTHWVDQGGVLTGVQYLAGHKRLETTAKYVRPNLQAARAVLGSRA